MAYSEKPFGLLDGDRGRYRQLLAGGHDVDDRPGRRSANASTSACCRSAGCSTAAAEDPHRLRDGGEVRIDQVGAEVDDARGLHLQFDEVQRRVVEDRSP